MVAENLEFFETTALIKKHPAKDALVGIFEGKNGLTWAYFSQKKIEGAHSLEEIVMSKKEKLIDRTWIVNVMFRPRTASHVLTEIKRLDLEPKKLESFQSFQNFQKPRVEMGNLKMSLEDADFAVDIYGAISLYGNVTVGGVTKEVSAFQWNPNKSLGIEALWGFMMGKNNNFALRDYECCSPELLQKALDAVNKAQQILFGMHLYDFSIDIPGFEVNPSPPKNSTNTSEGGDFSLDTTDFTTPEEQDTGDFFASSTDYEEAPAEERRLTRKERRALDSKGTNQKGAKHKGTKHKKQKH